MQFKKPIIFILLITQLFCPAYLIYGQDNLRPQSVYENTRVDRLDFKLRKNPFEGFVREVISDLENSMPSLNLVGATAFILDQGEQILRGFPTDWNQIGRRGRIEIKRRIEVTLIKNLWIMNSAYLPLQEDIVRRCLARRRLPVYLSISEKKPAARVRMNEAMILLREQLAIVERVPGDFQLSPDGFRIVLRIPATPKELYKKIAGLKRASRRRFLRVASATGGLTVLAGSAVAKWAHYEYATDHSFNWKPYPEIPENETRFRPVWDSHQPPTALIQHMRRWGVNTSDLEQTRRLTRDLRCTLDNLVSQARSGDKAEETELAETTRDNFDLVVRLILQADPRLFPQSFAVQWELMRVKILLLDMLSIYAAAFNAGDERAEIIAKIAQDTSIIRFAEVERDPFVIYILSETRRRGGSNADPAWLLNGLFHNNVQSLLEGISKDSVNVSLRQRIRQISQPYLQEFPLAGGDNLFFMKIGSLLDDRSKRYPTTASFQEGARFYQTLMNGPVRPIAIEDLEAVRYARKELLSLVPYFLDSGRAHQIPPDVLAAVGLTNRMMNAFRPSYDLAAGLTMALRDAGGGENGAEPRGEESETPGLLERLPEVKIQDRATDWLAGRVMGASPTIGLLQIRGGLTPLHEFNVRDQDLWARWGVDSSALSNRDINGRLLDPQWNIEAAAALYEQMISEGIIRQEAGKVREMPNLRKLRNERWIVPPGRHDPILSYYGLDPILGTFLEGDHLPHFGDWIPYEYMINAMRNWGSRWFPHARILALEAGLFDNIPAKIVGLTDERQLGALFRAALPVLRRLVFSGKTHSRNFPLRISQNRQNSSQGGMPQE